LFIAQDNIVVKCSLCYRCAVIVRMDLVNIVAQKRIASALIAGLHPRSVASLPPAVYRR